MAICATVRVTGTGLVWPVLGAGLVQVMPSPASTANASGPLVPLTTAFGAREDRAKSMQKSPLESFVLRFSAAMPALDPLGRVMAAQPGLVTMLVEVPLTASQLHSRLDGAGLWALKSVT